MSSPDDNMAQMESGDEREDKQFQEYAAQICKHCTHKRRAHFYRDGCNEISTDSDPEVGILNRCHCTNFEVKE